MNKICTSIEQAKKLIGLGINTNTADMHYWQNVIIAFPFRESKHQEEAVPLWSLSGLLELMPEYVEGYSLEIRRVDSSYCCVYSDFHGEDFNWYYANNPIDAAFEMVCWLLEKGHIKADKVSERHLAKFKEGDWIVGPNGDILHIEKIDDSRYYFAPNQKVSWGIAECDSKSHLWTIKDAKRGDILSYRDGMWIFLFSKMIDQNSISYIALLSEDGTLTTFNSMYTLLMSALVPATPAQRDALLAKLSQKNYIWDKESLTLKESESETSTLEKASKEYSFNIESTLFQTIPVDLRELWKKEIENAFCSGAKWKEKYGK